MIIAGTGAACINKSAVARVKTFEVLRLLNQQCNDLRAVGFFHLPGIRGVSNPGQIRDDRVRAQ